LSQDFAETLTGLIEHTKKCNSVTLAVLGHLCDDGTAIGGEDGYFWAPSYEFKDGPATLNSLLRMAWDGQPRSGSVIVATVESTALETHLALCGVVEIGGNTGPPLGCVTVAIITPEVTLLRAGFSGQCRAAAVIRTSGSIEIVFDVVTSKHADDFRGALTNMFKQMGLPFQVKFQSQYALQIAASTGPRNSNILGGWRETANLDISLNRQDDRIVVNGVASVMVCRQALGRSDQYHGLDDAQRMTFATRFDSSVKAALKAPCRMAYELDAKTLHCN
jgi:hypothetical protein